MTNLDQDREQFKADLLAELKELKPGEITRSTQVDVPYVNSAQSCGIIEKLSRLMLVMFCKI